MDTQPDKHAAGGGATAPALDGIVPVPRARRQALPESSGYPAPEELVQRRVDLARSISGSADLSGSEVAQQRFGSVSAQVFTPATASGATMIYLHGGGYRLGSPAAWSPFISGLSEAIGSRIIAPRYRLAPEYPFPAAVNDVIEVYELLLADGRSDIVIAGDSAGGGLAAATLLRARDMNLPTPRAAVLLCPWVDLTVTASSYVECERSGALFTRAHAVEAAAMYLGETSRLNPLASPAHGDWTGLPPMLIQASDADVLRDDGRLLAQRALAAGVRVWYQEYSDVPHDWQVNQHGQPSTQLAVEQVVAFLRTVGGN